MDKVLPVDAPKNASTFVIVDHNCAFISYILLPGYIRTG